MIDKLALTNLIQDKLNGFDYELITLTISAQNDILVEVDRLAGVDVDFCSELNNYICEALDTRATDFGGKSGEELDYSLEVGSVSLTDPFKTKMQYEKNLGHDVEVLASDGKKYRGQLVSVDEDTFSVDCEVMVQVKGKKRKQKEIQTFTWAYADVKNTRYDLKF